MLGQKSLKVDDIERSLNKVAEKYNIMESQYKRWYTIANEAIEQTIIDNLDINNFTI